MKLRIALVATMLLTAALCSAAQITCPAGASHCAQVSWTAPTTSDAPTGYNVYHTTTNGGCATLTATTCTKAGSTVVPTTSFMDSPLTSSTTYFWVVTATNAGGESAGTVPVGGTTGTNAPGTPQTVIIQVK